MSNYVKFKKFSKLPKPEPVDRSEPMDLYWRKVIKKTVEGYSVFDAMLYGLWAYDNERRTKMNKFKPGDKVRVLDYRGDRRKYENWTPSMDEYVGKILTIKRQHCEHDEYYFTVENVWTWHQDWLAPAIFTKDDIQEFDVVEFRDGRMSLVADLGDGLETVCSFISSYYDNLTMTELYRDPADIMKVYRPKDNLPTDKSKWKDLPIIWERKEFKVKEMTVEEISEALGYKVKIVGEEV